MDGLHRLIDANANRAREGLRVVEDVARYALDDAETLKTIKGIRHELSSVLAEIDPEGSRLVRARDVDGDAGRTLEGAGEYARAGLADVIGANAKRVEESLRAIEEGCKALELPEASRRIERARYAVYGCEQRLVVRARARSVPSWPLCVIVTRALCKHMDWRDVIRASVEGGATCFQLREKDVSSRELSSVAREFVGLCHELGAGAIINDRADIALLSGADGVHVGLDDPPIGEVVDAFGDRLIVGASSPSVEHAREAIGAGASYLGVGSMFETSTKAKDGIAGTGLLEEVLALAGCPHVLAIGGISESNVVDVVDAGGRGAAVSSSVCGAEDPASACSSIIGIIEKHQRTEA